MCHKQRHKDIGVALKNMQWLNRNKEGYDIKNIYWCKYCKSWHLTSKGKF